MIKKIFSPTKLYCIIMEMYDWIILICVVFIATIVVVMCVNAALDRRLSNVQVCIQKGYGSNGEHFSSTSANAAILQRDSAPVPSYNASPSLSPNMFQWEPPLVSPTLLGKVGANDVTKFMMNEEGEGGAENGSEIVQQLLNSEDMPFSSTNPQMIYGNPAFTNFMPNDVLNVKYPDYDDLLQYGKCKPEPKTTQESVPLEKMRISHDLNNNPNEKSKPNTYDPLHATPCNKSLTEQREGAYKYMVENDKRYIYDNGQCNRQEATCGSECNMIGSNCVSNNFSREPKVLYQREQRFVPASLEDAMVRGGNIGNYGEYGVFSDIGKIDLSRDTVFPQPENYIFKTSGVYSR